MEENDKTDEILSISPLCMSLECCVAPISAAVKVRSVLLNRL